VADVKCSVHDREHAEHEGDHRTEAGPEPRECDDRPGASRKRDDGRQRMLVEIDAGLAVQECVVERVQDGDRRRGAEGGGLPAPVQTQGRVHGRVNCALIQWLTIFVSKSEEVGFPKQDSSSRLCCTHTRRVPAFDDPCLRR
jgi:hypothetical protein